MAAARLIHSHSQRALQQAGAAFLAKHRRRVLIIAPSRGAADDFARVHAGRNAAGVERFTLTTLAAQLSLGTLQPGDRPASRLALEALTARLLEELRRDGRIPYFQPVADTPGLARAVTATILELRLNGVTAAEVAATGAPGRDLAGILSAFEEHAAGSLLDLAAILQRAALNQQHPLLGLPVLWLCCEIPSLHHGLLARHILTRSPDVLALAPTGDLPNRRALQAILEVPEEYIGPATAIERVADSLFAADVEPVEDRRIRFFSAAGEGLECVEIARNIRQIADEGVAFDEIAVLLRSPERYQTLMEEALRRAGIPAYFTRGVARPDPSGRAFLALLACGLDGCSATRFAEYLSLGQVPEAGDRDLARPASGPDDELLAGFAAGAGAATALETDDTPGASRFLPSPFGWERLIVDAAVVGGGRARWERRLKGLETELRFQLAAAQREDPARSGRIERQIEQVRALSGFALPLIEALGLLPAQARWGDWLDALADLAGQSLKRPDSVLAALEELRAMEETGPVDLSEVYKVLSDRMRFLRREPSKVRYGQVFVAGISEIRGRSFRAVFVPGLAEGLFPRRATEDPILLDAYRARISGKPLADQAERVRQERMLLHLAVGSAGEYLYYSYPRMDVMQNRPRVPSFYALELLRATRGKLPELKSFEHEAAAHAPTRLDWPAPAHPDEAIDHAEFDLAMLRHAARGGGRYLMHLNPHLVRSLRARAGRWRNRWFPADGFVDGDKTAVETLAAHRLQNRAYSPSALQTYAACPYKFLLQGIHRIEAREEPAGIEQLDPLTRGEIFHAVQFRLMLELQARNALPVTRQNRVDAIALADQVLTEVAAAYADDLAPAITRVWNNEIDELRTDLRAWLIDVSERSFDWIPAHFELSFGLNAGAGTRDVASRPDPVSLPGLEFLVRGSIDLVERHANTGALRITDHKTGSYPQRPPVFTAGGSVLQPVLYAMAASQLMPGTPVQAGRLYYCTRKGDYREIQIPLNAESRTAIEKVLTTIDSAIAEGFLPAYPKADACSQCDFRIVCGPYEAERTARKRKDRILPLLELREQP